MSSDLQPSPPQPVFWNTLGRRLEPLVPLDPPHVRLYTCGPTVYNDVHIGNLRTFLFEDFLRRSLKYLGFEVTQVMNITDVDDKTILGAYKKGVPLNEYTAPFIESFLADLDRLHVERADHYPRATEYVAEMIEIIATLVEKGFAYEADGSVFFRIASDPDYGKLSGFHLDAARRGERVADDEYDKEDVRDFVLWKAVKPGEPSWDSPWGPGRPGWHIECSAMSMKFLGKSFDMHCGGVDNIFPHHENEIAQSESAFDQPFVRIWLHAEHLIVDGQKMSKSLGNQYRLDELIARKLPVRAIRYLFLSVHYRQKLNFTFESLDAAAAALRRIDDMRHRLDHAPEKGEMRPEIAAAADRLQNGFGAALADDLNASEALAALFGFVREVNVAIDGGTLGEGDKERVGAALAAVDRVLGVLDADAWRDASADDSDEKEIDAMVVARDAARAGRDFATSDRLRDELAARGIVLEDTPHGTRWKRR